MKITLQAYGKQMILFVISFLIIHFTILFWERLKETPNPWNKSLISAKKKDFSRASEVKMVRVLSLRPFVNLSLLHKRSSSYLTLLVFDVSF